MKFNEKLSCLKKEKHYSQEELAEKLSVSRQAVSKWESGTSYPEMDKLLLICKIFDCTLEELTSDRINVSEIKDKEVKNVNAVIEEVLETLSLTCNLFSGIGFFKGFKLVFKLFMIALFVGLALFIPVIVIEDLGSNLFWKLGEIGSLLMSLWRLVLAIVSIVIYVIIMYYIYKNVFLSKYEFVNEEDIKKEKIETKVEEIENKKVIIERVNTKGSSILKYLSKICVFFTKFIIFLMLMPFIGMLICFALLLTIDIYLITEGIMFYGIFLGLIACILITLVIIIILSSWLGSKKVNFKSNLIIFISSLVLGGVASGILTLEIAKFNYYDEAPNEKLNTESVTIKYEEDLVIRSYFANEINYVIDNSIKGNEINISYTHYKDFTKIETSKNNNTYYIALYYNEFNKNYLDVILDNLKDRELYDYEQLNNLSITIKANKNIISKLKENDNKLYQYEYDETLSKCEYDRDRYNDRIYELEDKISELENEIENIRSEKNDINYEYELLEKELEEYKNKLEEIRNYLD